MKNKRLMRMRLWIGVSLLVGALWTGAALGGVIAGDSTTAPPANDDFANAIVLTGANVTRTGDTNVDATAEAGEPDPVAGAHGGASVWYFWTAPSNDEVVIDLAGSDFDTILGVYTGTAVNALTEVASNDDFIDSVTSRVRFKASSGTVYRIKVDGFNDGFSVSEGSINLHLHQDPPPANDNFAGAVVLTGTNDSSLGDTNEGATLEAGEAATVAGSTGGASVWYSWTAPSTGQATIDTATSDFNTLLGVYTGASVNALTEVASNDDSLAGETSQVRFRANSGTTYRIKVDGRQADTGTINLHLNELPPPPNDDFANAVVLTGKNASRTGDTNVGATLEPDEDTTVAQVPGGTSVWYTWTAPDNGRVTIDTATSDFDTLLGVYTGSTLASLVEVASNDDAAPNLTSAVSFNVTATTVYKIRVDGVAGDSGTINLHLALATAPDAPTIGAATAGNGSATVTWTAPASDGGSAITGYEVTPYIGLVAQTATNVGAVTQTTVSGLANGTTYTFRVAATNLVGTGAQSAASNAVTPRTVPDAPTSVSATAGNASATVSWTAPAFNGGSAITGYEVTPYVGAVAQAPTSVGVVTQTTVSGLTNGTTYTFRVAATNVAGTGAPSADSNAVTPKLDQTISVTMHAPASATFGTSFTVAATAPGGAVSFSSSGSCTSSGATFTMTSGTGTCSVKYDQSGSGTYNAAPQVVESVTAQKANQVVSVTTHAPANAGYGASFTVAATSPAGAVSFSSTGSCSNVGATFTMTAATGTCSVMYDQGGNANYNAAPQVVESVTAQKAGQSIAVTTHAPATAVAGSSFTVAATAPGGPVTYSSSGSCTNSGALFTMTAAVGTCSVKYDQAGSANYNAAPQVVESVTAVAAATAPDAPTAVSASAGNAQATVVWTAPASNGGSAVTGYDVTRYVAGTAQGTTSVGVVTQTTVTGLTNGTTYTFRVAAKNAVGTGAQSADSNAVTPSAPRFTLTVSKSGSGSGTVTSSVGGINCGATCAADFDAGASVTLTATAASGSTFTGWSGACTGSASCTVTMDAAKSVTATFAPPSPPQTVVNCVVPNVKGKTLAAAKRKIAAGHCKTGKVTTTKSKTVAKGKVISQSPRAGKKLARSAKVNLVVSRGKR